MSKKARGKQNACSKQQAVKKAKDVQEAEESKDEEEEEATEQESEDKEETAYSEGSASDDSPQSNKAVEIIAERWYWDNASAQRQYVVKRADGTVMKGPRKWTKADTHDRREFQNTTIKNNWRAKTPHADVQWIFKGRGKGKMSEKQKSNLQKWQTKFPTNLW